MDKRVIMLDFNGKVSRVYFDEYVSAKLKSLQDFGYKDLTEREVREQAERVLQGVRGMSKDGLNVIGMMMENEISEATL